MCRFRNPIVRAEVDAEIAIDGNGYLAAVDTPPFGEAFANAKMARNSRKHLDRHRHKPDLLRRNCLETRRVTASCFDPQERE